MINDPEWVALNKTKKNLPFSPFHVKECVGGCNNAVSCVVGNLSASKIAKTQLDGGFICGSLVMHSKQ